MTPADLAAARELLRGLSNDSRTDAPWTAKTLPRMHCWEVVDVNGHQVAACMNTLSYRPMFLAAARTLVPSLLDLVSQQAARIAELEGERDKLRSAAPVMLTALALIADESDEAGIREVALWYSERTANALVTWLDAHRANEKDRTP